jgi:D-lyxose ketol-isomerase
MKNLLLTSMALFVLAAACSNSNPENENKIAFDNADFYSADGAFDVDKAKDAIMVLMEYHGYPVFPGMKEGLWVSDYGTGQFTKLGLAAHLFKNNEEDRYMLMDLFLLPGQMLPEHWHLDGESNPAKLEGWLIRWGKSYVVGIGEDNLASFPEVKIPEVHMNGEVTTKHIVAANPGDFVPVAKVYSRHWQFAGPEGAIITEVANVHTDVAVRHSDKAINDHFLGI